MIQGDAEWYAARLGQLSASRVADAVAKTKSGYGDSRANLMAKLICERLTGVPMETYTSQAMQWGLDTEPQAKAAYEFQTDSTIESVGYIPHPHIEHSGASPDGLIGADGLVEIKCPNTATHIETLLSKKVPDKYIIQMLWQMACTGRKWCDYVSFDPRLPENLQLFIKRVPRDDSRIEELSNEVNWFLEEMDEKLEGLRKIVA